MSDKVKDRLEARKRSLVKNKLKKKKGKNKILWGRVFIFVLILLSILAGIGYGVVKVYDYVTQNYIVSTEVNDEVEPPKLAVKKYETLPFYTTTNKPEYIMVLGVDEHKNNEIATVYLVAINQQDKEIDVIGIPNNSKIVSRDKKSAELIKDVYRQGDINVTKAIVEDIFHIQIPFFVVYNENSFTQIYDKIGGISLYIEDNFKQYDETGRDISLTQGYQSIDAGKAWAYITYNNANEMGSESIQRQERLTKFIFDKFYNQNVFSRIWDIFGTWNLLESNISRADMLKFIIALRNLPLDKVNYYILPGVKENIDNKIYWDINPIEAQRLVGITIKNDGGN